MDDVRREKGWCSDEGLADRREFLRIAGLTLGGFVLLSPLARFARADLPICGGGVQDITCGSGPMPEGDENCGVAVQGTIDPDDRCSKLINEVRQEDLSCGHTATGAVWEEDKDCGQTTGNTNGYCPDNWCGGLASSDPVTFDPDANCGDTHWSGSPLFDPDESCVNCPPDNSCTVLPPDNSCGLPGFQDQNA